MPPWATLRLSKLLLRLTDDVSEAPPIATAMPPPIAVAAVGPGAAGTALGQVAQEDGVGDGRGRVILESETAADAIATGAPLAPAPPIAVLPISALLLSATLPPLLKMPPPMPSPPAPPLALLLMILLEPTFSVPWLEMPPPATAELPLTVQLVSVAGLDRCTGRRRLCRRSCR